MATGTTSVSINASGIDTETLIQSSLQVYQSRYDSLYKKKVEEEWTKEAYADVYNSIKDYRYGDASNYKLSSYTTARVASSTNSDAVTATVNADAIEMTHDVKVNSLATASYLQSYESMDITSNKLSDIAGITIDDSNKESEDVALSFEIGDGSSKATVSFTYKDLADGKTLNDLASRINNTGLNVKAVYDSTNKSFSITNKSTGASNGISIQAGGDASTAAFKAERDTAKESLTTAGAAITAANGGAFDTTELDELIKEGDTTALNDYINKQDSALTNSLNAYVTAAQTYNTKQTEYEAALSGSASAAVIDKFNFAKYNSADGSLIKVSASDLADGVYGTNGEAVIDGKTYSLESNSVTVANVSYQLNDVTTSTAKVSISTDKEALVESVQSFVDTYNSLLDMLNEKLHESSYSDYGALTEDEESEMTEAQLEKWEAKAKSGLLNDSDQLQNLVDSMRQALSTSISGLDGKYTSAYSIGIGATGSYDEYGHLYLDTEKLEAAIDEDPDIVYKIFSTNSKDYDSQGIAYRLSDAMASAMSSMSDYSGTSSASDDQSYLGLKIQDYDERLSALQELMDSKYDFYYSKYSAMEQAIANMQSAMSSISAYLGTNS